MKCSVKQETIQYWNTRVKKLTFQGDFVKLLIEEKENATWQSVSNNIPKGVLSFALKACSNGLNTPDNLKRWGIRKTSKCELCGNYSNLEHILQKHQNLLIQKKLLIYADLPGMSLNGGTIPVDIVANSLRPDIVIVNGQEKSS